MINACIWQKQPTWKELSFHAEPDHLIKQPGVVKETDVCWGEGKEWRFTFITYYQCTFLVWRVAEDRYAIPIPGACCMTLNRCTLQADKIWMLLAPPWGTQLLPGAPLSLGGGTPGAAGCKVAAWQAPGSAGPGAPGPGPAGKCQEPRKCLYLDWQQTAATDTSSRPARCRASGRPASSLGSC